MGEVSLEWKDHDKDMSNKLWEFFKEEYLVDFNVTCHGQQKKVHKFVLAFLVPILKESLRSSDTFSLEEEPTRNLPMLPPSALCLNLDNIADHPEDMDYLIQYAYTGKLTVREKHADCLKHIADSMEIESLKESIGQWHKKTEKKSEPNAVTPLSKLRPRTQLKKMITESVDKISSNDDLDLNSMKDSNFESIVRSEDFSDDNGDEEIISRSGKKNKVSQKRQSQRGGGSKKKSRKSQKSIKTDADKNTELFMCKYCDYTSRLKTLLRNHIIAIHQLDTDGNPLEKNVKCPDCDFVCYAKHQLQNHILAKHKRLNMFKCKKCDYTFPYKCELVRHERHKHQNIRNFVCEDCEQGFMSKTRLNDHVLIHHKGVKPYKCDICSAEYSDPSNFKLHVKRHLGKVEYKFVCPVCGHRWRKKCDMKKHVQKIHGMELEETVVPTNPSQLKVLQHDVKMICT